MANMERVQLDTLMQLTDEAYDPNQYNLGLTVDSTDERPTISRSGKPSTQTVISLTTDLGNSGTLILENNQAAALSDRGLAIRLVAKRDELDRPTLMSMVK